MKWNDYQGNAGGQGWEVKFNKNMETIMASARGVPERKKQGADVSTLEHKCCLSPTSTWQYVALEH